MAKDIVLDVGAPGPPPNILPIEHQQEKARKWLAFGLVGILAFEVLFAAIALLLSAFILITVDNIKELLLVIFGPTVALVGSALGFYFGQKPPERSRDSDIASQPD